MQSLLDPKDVRSLVFVSSTGILVLASVGLVFRLVAAGLGNVPIPGMLIVLLLAVNVAYLRLGGSAERGAWLLTGILLLGLAFSGYNTGGFSGPITILSPLIPIVATLLIGAKAGMVAVVVEAFILSGLLFFQLQGTVPDSVYGPTGILIGRYLSVLFTCLIATAVVWGFAQTVRTLIDENETLAHTDHLTGIANRRSVEQGCAIEFARARRSGAPISVLMIDVDQFKRYNDVNGHTEGDRCLKVLAQVLTDSIRRPADIVGRYGGEEFIAVLPDTDTDGARARAESIRAALEKLGMPYEPGGKDSVTVSIGVASATGDDIISPQALIKSADEALYDAKQAGRNCVRLSSV